jgi:hypothetical protein
MSRRKRVLVHITSLEEIAACDDSHQKLEKLEALLEAAKKRRVSEAVLYFGYT